MTEDATLLQGKLALVTGSSSGAGVEIATALARRGARVAVHYRTSRAAAEMVARAIGDGGGEAAAFQADIARADDVRRLIEEVGERLGPISILVNNAGPFCDTPFTMLAEPDWDYVMDANLKSVYVAAQQVAPEMARLGWGRIVNVGATSGLVRSHGVYGLAKAALLSLTESLAVELAPHITVDPARPPRDAGRDRADGRPPLLARLRLRHRAGDRDGRRPHDTRVRPAESRGGDGTVIPRTS